MSNMVWVVIGVIVVLLIVFRKSVYALLPMPEKAKADLVSHDLVDNLTKSTTFHFPTDTAEMESLKFPDFKGIIDAADMGLATSEPDDKPVMNLVDLEQRLISGQNPSPDELREFLSGSYVQQETSKEYGTDVKNIIIKETLPDGIMIQGGAVIKYGNKVSGEILNRLFGLGLPPNQEYLLQAVSESGKPTIKPLQPLVQVIHDESGDIFELPADNIPEGYSILKNYRPDDYPEENLISRTQRTIRPTN